MSKIFSYIWNEDHGVGVPITMEAVNSALTQTAATLTHEILSCSYYLVFYPGDMCNDPVLIAQRTLLIH